MLRKKDICLLELRLFVERNFFNSHFCRVCEITSDTPLCFNCSERIIKHGSLDIKGHKLLYLIPWWNFSKENDPVKKLLHQLKGGRDVVLWSYLVSQLVSMVGYQEKSVFAYPLSKSTQVFPDHAATFAYWASQLLNPLEIVGLRSERASKQALLSRAERGLKTFQSVRPKARGMSVVFLDDVVTTGATLSAAHRALGQPRNFLAMSIFRRM